MIKLFRMSPWADLSGRGGVLAQGRWHHAGRPVVYMADHPAAAMLETLVHLEVDPEDLPEDYQLLTVHIPKSVSQEELVLEELGEDWKHDQERTRRIGDEWLAGGRSLLLGVPSAIMPHANNYLMNPAHPEAEQVQFEAKRYAFDERLLKNKLGG